MRVLLAILFATLAVKASADEAQARKDCTWDAIKHCKATFSNGRDAIIGCMVKNKPKLSAKCRKHLT